MERNKVKIQINNFEKDPTPARKLPAGTQLDDHLLEQMADRYLQDKRRWAEDKTTKLPAPLPVEKHKKHVLPYKVLFTQGTIQIFKSMKSPWAPYYLWYPVNTIDPTSRVRRALKNLLTRTVKPAPAPVGKQEFDDAKAVREFVEAIHSMETERQARILKVGSMVKSDMAANDYGQFPTPLKPKAKKNVRRPKHK
jgi:hypothetical protein